MEILPPSFSSFISASIGASVTWIALLRYEAGSIAKVSTQSTILLLDRRQCLTENMRNANVRLIPKDGGLAHVNFAAYASCRVCPRFEELLGLSATDTFHFWGSSPTNSVLTAVRIVSASPNIQPGRLGL